MKYLKYKDGLFYFNSNVVTRVGKNTWYIYNKKLETMDYLNNLQKTFEKDYTLFLRIKKLKRINAKK